LLRRSYDSGISHSHTHTHTHRTLRIYRRANSFVNIPNLTVWVRAHFTTSNLFVRYPTSMHSHNPQSTRPFVRSLFRTYVHPPSQPTRPSVHCYIYSVAIHTHNSQATRPSVHCSIYYDHPSTQLTSYPSVRCSIYSVTTHTAHNPLVRPYERTAHLG